MLFSSLVFIYIFLPLALFFYYIVPKTFKNSFLLLASLFFFAWGGVSYSFLLLFSILLNYVFGLLIDRKDNRKLWLAFGISINLLLLIVFKYANFILENFNSLLTWFSIPLIKNPSILLPIGISFYTFQAISYLVDVYHKTCESQKNIINLGLFISLFPQLIAGPIVRYHDIKEQIQFRLHSLEKFKSGIMRFVLGFAKKVLIANSMAYVADEVFSLQADTLSPLTAWIGILAYTMQIYYDFSGYSDMAIGLGRMFGFEILENFNFPYISKSIKEFWRRWHISLSNWFRDYLYIPLGGNRINNGRTIINLFIVFFITGFWHGASWSFLIWGLLHGFFLVMERSRFGNILNKLPFPFQYAYTLFIVIMAWVLFRADNLLYAMDYYKALFGFGESVSDPFLLHRIITRETAFIFIIAVLGASGFFQSVSNFLESKLASKQIEKSAAIYLVKGILSAITIAIVLLYGTGNLVLEAYNPFIYFRF
jgi:alginate O-acetyltransferase complex protein AlgI